MTRGNSKHELHTVSPTFIDLFSGCGGFSFGMQRAGFTEIASIDSNPEAISVFQHNFPQVPHALEHDLTVYTPAELYAEIGGAHPDIVIGGPPCQGFSKTRKVDGANSGVRFIEDERRNLYREFLKFVEFFQPKMFVMENVPGIRSAAEGEFFMRIQSEARRLGYKVISEVIRSWEYGVPQKRERQLIFGTRADLPIFSSALYMRPTHPTSADIVTLWEAIGDLPPLRAGEGKEESMYDLERRNRHLLRYGNRYLTNVLELDRAQVLTAHVARPHSKRDLRDFDRLAEGENSAHAIAHGVKMEFPYDRDNFKDRYTRQHRNRLCSTIVAHLSKDGLMFIHPTQTRSLTPREAARVQSFPDWFQFPVPRSHQYRLIGNAVPPLVGQALGHGIGLWLSAINKKSDRQLLDLLPDNERDALSHILHLLVASELGMIKGIATNDFKRGWFAIGFLYRHLHPESIRQNGTTIIDANGDVEFLAQLAPNLGRLTFAQSGWPVTLVPIAQDARRRFDRGELTADEYYFSQAQIAGFNWFNNRRRQNGA